jgi:hypothetical protein
MLTLLEDIIADWGGRRMRGAARAQEGFSVMLAALSWKRELKYLYTTRLLPFLS